MSKFLVTGGAGFIGNEICHLLISLGHEVLAFDNLSSGHIENISDLLNHPKFQFIKGDVTNYQECLKAGHGVDYIIHQAALVSVPKSIEEPLLNNEINVKGFVNILEAARMNHVKKVVYASSSAVYGDNPDEIKVEERTGLLLSPYALSKQADEWYAKLYTKLYNLPTTGLRYFNVYGPKQDPSSVYSGVISIFFKRASNHEDFTIFGDGTMTRDFINVADVAKANLQACLFEATGGEVYNIGTGRFVSINELADLVIKVTKARSKIKYEKARFGDIQYSCANVNKALKQLGFEASISLEEGLKQMVNQIKEGC